jgi:hypothetical protein
MFYNKTTHAQDDLELSKRVYGSTSFSLSWSSGLSRHGLDDVHPCFMIHHGADCEDMFYNKTTHAQDDLELSKRVYGSTLFSLSWSSGLSRHGLDDVRPCFMTHHGQAFFTFFLWTYVTRYPKCGQVGPELLELCALIHSRQPHLLTSSLMRLVTFWYYVVAHESKMHNDWAAICDEIWTTHRCCGSDVYPKDLPQFQSFIVSKCWEACAVAKGSACVAWWCIRSCADMSQPSSSQVLDLLKVIFFCLLDFLLFSCDSSLVKAITSVGRTVDTSHALEFQPTVCFPAWVQVRSSTSRAYFWSSARDFRDPTHSALFNWV